MSRNRQPSRDNSESAVQQRIREYEKLGGEYFFMNVKDDPPSSPLMPDDVDYLHEKPKTRILGMIANALARVMEVAVKRIYRIDVRGEENLRDITGGAVITSNHFHETENIAVKAAAEKADTPHRLYKVVREGNFFMPGILGFLLKYADTLPLSSNMRTMVKLDKAIARILKNGDFILIYPEQSMWCNYRKPRPYRNGAFYYAAKNSVPVIPCFVTVSEFSAKSGKTGLKYTIHIMPPIYPDPNLKNRENTRIMLERNFELCKSKYEEVYGIPLEY